uniref:Secreted protein n=1 Tax=Rhipicephalus appendiculatus TaxID=34631 RepID=A0A131YE24_RHIAP
MLLGLSCGVPVVVCWLKNVLLLLRSVSVDVLSHGNFNLTPPLTFFYRFACSLKERSSLKSLATTQTCMTCWFAEYIAYNKNILLYAFIAT